MTIMLLIDPHKPMGLAELQQLSLPDTRIQLSAQAKSAIQQAHDFLQQTLAKDPTPIYGVNTGVGKLASTKIDAAKLQQLQRNMLLSHACGVGELLELSNVRLILALKIMTLASGYSGVRLELIQALIDLYNHEIYPCVPAQGSVGACGDLAPLAHLALPLVGEGKAHYKNKMLKGNDVLALIKQSPFTLQAKEGIALINGTEVSTSIALAALFQSYSILQAAITAGSLSLLASQSDATPFAAAIHHIRLHAAQIDLAKIYAELIQETNVIVKSQRVQDPYSLRCQPQVMGACLTQMRFAATQLVIEANAVTDNPLIFAAEQKLMTGGNFHAQPVAFACDNLALAIAEMGAMAERRIAFLLDTSLSGLPAFLTCDPGLQPGFMLAQVTAASLVSENKHLANPISCDSIPTSANQEDHVSMATYAARRLHPMNQNAATIIAIELLATCQALDLVKLTPRLLSRKSSSKLAQAYVLVRKYASFVVNARVLAPDIEAVKAAVLKGEFAFLQGLRFVS